MRRELMQRASSTVSAAMSGASRPASGPAPSRHRAGARTADGAGPAPRRGCAWPPRCEGRAGPAPRGSWGRSSRERAARWRPLTRCRACPPSARGDRAPAHRPRCRPRASAAACRRSSRRRCRRAAAGCCSRAGWPGAAPARAGCGSSRPRPPERDEGLATLAARVGYQSEAAFSRAFKRVTGMTPGSLQRDTAPAAGWPAAAAS
ncbi:MAG: AraC family transcriptional regulator [Aquabacterium sp.]|nr:MAG: AraC family transcriptional regulator [Aquabacterium sp.]